MNKKVQEAVSLIENGKEYPGKVKASDLKKIKSLVKQGKSIEEIYNEIV